jgi:hypothetical protein
VGVRRRYGPEPRFRGRRGLTAIGDFLGAIGRGVGGLVGGSIHALSVAFDTIVGTLQALLPGPLFPVVMVGGGLLAIWLLRKAVL